MTLTWTGARPVWMAHRVGLARQAEELARAQIGENWCRHRLEILALAQMGEQSGVQAQIGDSWYRHRIKRLGGGTNETVELQHRHPQTEEGLVQHLQNL